MMSNKPLLIYNYSEGIIKFTYDNFGYVLNREEVEIPTISWLQKVYWSFPIDEFLALVLTDEATYQSEALLVFITGFYHGYAKKGGTYIRFSDIYDWNLTKDALTVNTKTGSYSIKTSNFNLLSLALFMDACRSEAGRFNSFKNTPRTGKKKPSFWLSERQILNRNIKKQIFSEKNIKKIATTFHETAFALQVHESENKRNLAEIDKLLSLYYQKEQEDLYEKQ